MVLGGRPPSNFKSEFLGMAEFGGTSATDSPSDLQPSFSLGELEWMDHCVDLDSGTPCLEDLLDVNEEFDTTPSSPTCVDKSFNEQLSQPWLNAFLTPSFVGHEVGRLTPSMWEVTPSSPEALTSHVTVADCASSEVCPSPSSSYHVPQDILPDEENCGSIYASSVPLPVVEADNPPSLLLAQESRSPVRADPPRCPSTPASLIDVSYNNRDWEVALSAESKATIQPEGTTGVKALLHKKITNKRKSQGLEEKPDTKERKVTNEMTPADIERYERRKASNRKAATKLRLKKKDETERLTEEKAAIERHNTALREEVKHLRDDVERLQDAMTRHHSECHLDDFSTLGGSTV